MRFSVSFNARTAKAQAGRTPLALTPDWIATWCLCGSPATVIEHLKPYQALGIGNILCGTLTGQINP